MNIISAYILTTGIWRAALLTPGGELPFMLEVDTVKSNYTFTIINGSEHILLNDVTIKDDSLIVKFPVFESELHLKADSKNHLNGVFINLTRTSKGVIPFEAYAGNKPRFNITPKKQNALIFGKWSVVFDPGKADSTNAVGQFQQEGDKVTGTFLTSSGDYRFFEGMVSGDSVYLSTFNGVFAYLFKAKISGVKMSGDFYSGIHGHETVTALRNQNAMLPDANKITTIKNDSNGFVLRFPGTDSILVSLNDSQFNGKPVVIQIMGSWCPNCLDEAMFLGPFYDVYKPKGLEMIGLSFEKTDDFKRAAANVDRFRKRLQINYTLLVASNRDKIRQTLPALENFISFPTTIFLDKKHQVRRVHAGFLGAATGKEYESFKTAFTEFIDQLLSE